MNRVDPIVITDNDTGVSYTLEFNRDTVRRFENDGYTVQDLGKYPSRAYDIWHYAFYMHHNRDFLTRKLSRQKTDDLLDAIGGPLNAPKELWDRLGDLYIQAYTTLEGDEKNGRVTVKF